MRKILVAALLAAMASYGPPVFAQDDPTCSNTTDDAKKVLDQHHEKYVELSVTNLLGVTTLPGSTTLLVTTLAGNTAFAVEQGDCISQMLIVGPIAIKRNS